MNTLKLRIKEKRYKYSRYGDNIRFVRIDSNIYIDGKSEINIKGNIPMYYIFKNNDTLFKGHSLERNDVIQILKTLFQYEYVQLDNDHFMFIDNYNILNLKRINLHTSEEYHEEILNRGEGARKLCKILSAIRSTEIKRINIFKTSFNPYINIEF